MCRYSPGVIVHYREAAAGTLGTPSKVDPEIPNICSSLTLDILLTTEKLKLCDICGADYNDDTPRETSYYKCFRCSRLFSRAGSDLLSSRNSCLARRILIARVWGCCRSSARACSPPHQLEAIWLSLLSPHLFSPCSLERAYRQVSSRRVGAQRRLGHHRVGCVLGCRAFPIPAQPENVSPLKSPFFLRACRVVYSRPILRSPKTLVLHFFALFKAALAGMRDSSLLLSCWVGMKTYLLPAIWFRSENFSTQELKRSQSSPADRIGSHHLLCFVLGDGLG